MPDDPDAFVPADAPFDAGLTPIGVVLRRPVAVTVLLVALSLGAYSITLLATQSDLMDDSESEPWVWISAISIAFLFLAATVALTKPAHVFYAPLLRSHLSGALVWVASPASLSAAVTALRPSQQHRRYPLTAYVVLRADELTIWTRSGTTLSPALLIPRSRIRSIVAQSGPYASSLAVAVEGLRGSDVSFAITANARLSSMGRMTREVGDANEHIIRWQRMPRT